MGNGQDADGADAAAAAAAAERACDRNMAIFMQSIRDSDNVACTAIVAIKARAPALAWLAASAVQRGTLQTPHDAVQCHSLVLLSMCCKISDDVLLLFLQNSISLSDCHSCSAATVVSQCA